MEKFHIIVEVKTSYPLTEEAIMEELLLAETRMNTTSRLRFYVISPPKRKLKDRFKRLFNITEI